MTKNSVPKSGLAGLKENWSTDILSGFFVLLLALPLSLGIAKASGFPPAMGVFTAMIGGLMVAFLKVSPLTIKGPAAGLITVCSGAIIEFGGGEQGWQMACGVIVVMALLQVAFGWLKFGTFSDFFPHSAVHGMLAAIGLIIIAKQIPVLLGDDPILYKGESPLELFMDIPRFIQEAHPHIAIVGIIGLLILFTFPLLKKYWISKIPAPLIILLICIPLSLIWHFKTEEPAYSLVVIGDFWNSISFNADFSGIATFTFWKYVVIFLLVSSLESLLTVKAIDGLDPLKRKSDYNKDLSSLGVGNAIVGLFGGIPMISEVVRSSANAGFGGKTKWSAFFHGAFLLIAMLLLIPVIELIPNSALAALLIYAGYRLASPKEFRQTYKTGKEQFAIFLVTIIVTLLEDLLLGIAAGILVKFIFHLINGAQFKYLFKATYERNLENKTLYVSVKNQAIFSNLIGYNKCFEIDENESVEEVIVDFTACNLVDHSFMDFMHKLNQQFKDRGIAFTVKGLEEHKAFSKSHLAARKLVKIKKN